MCPCDKCNPFCTPNDELLDGRKREAALLRAPVKTGMAPARDDEDENDNDNNNNNNVERVTARRLFF